MKRLICFFTGHRMTTPTPWMRYASVRWFRNWNCGCCGKRLHTQSFNSDEDPNEWLSPWSPQ